LFMVTAASSQRTVRLSWGGHSMSKPVPHPTTDSAAFWVGCNRDELLYQRCRACDHVQFYPRPTCTRCQSDKLDLAPSARRGTIHSFTVVHRTANRAFDSDVPFVIALIDLDEGFRMMMNVIGDGRLSAAIGRRIRVTFEACSAEQKLPQARLEAAT
jgi:uncharacterized protein